MAGVFKAYDVRGVYPSDINEDLAYKIGLAFGNLLGQGKNIVCSRDGRPHSPPIQDAFINGATDAGLDVVNMGLGTTPMCYYACFSDHYDGSVAVTASHNPGQYNGLKFCLADAVPMGYPDGLDRIEAAIQANQLRKATSKGKVTHRTYDQAYLQFIAEKARLDRAFRFAVDCGNGMGGHVIQPFLDLLGQEADILYGDLDFTFPNHLANPLDFSNLRDLQESVTRNGYDFGVAFDGDADRCFFVDDKGRVVAADILTTLIAVNSLQENGPSPVVYDVRSSRVVEEQVRRLGAEPVLCRVGHSFMKAKLREMDGDFGGELAGHFYFKAFAYADSALLTMLTVMNILCKHGRPLSQLIDPYLTYVPSGEINFVTEKADALLAEAATRFPGGKVLDIDGIRIDFEKWWFCLRKSNTEPLLRLVVEATDQDTLDSQLEAINQWLIGEGAQLATSSH